MEKRPKNPYKMSAFEGGHPKIRKMKKMDFLQKMPDTICDRKGEKTRIFVHTISFGPKLFWDQNSENQKN